MKGIIPFVACRHGEKIADEGFHRGFFLDQNDREHVHLTQDAKKDFQEKGAIIFGYYQPTVIDGYHTIAVRTRESIENIALGAGLNDKLILTEELLLTPQGFALDDFRTFGYLNGNESEGIKKGDFDYATRMLARNHFQQKHKDSYSFASDISDTLLVFRNAIDNAVNLNLENYERPAIIISSHNPSIEAFNVLATDCITFGNGRSYMNGNFHLVEMGDTFYGIINPKKDEIMIQRFGSKESPKMIHLSELDNIINILYKASKTGQ